MKILRISFTSLFLLLILNDAIAQLSRSTLGIKGGMNISQLSVSGLSDEQNRIGYHFGAYIRLGLTETFSIQPELLLSTKGAELNYSTDFVKGSTVVSLKYADVPVLAVFNLTRNLNVHGGPYWSYLIDATADNQSTEGSTDFSEEISRDSFKNMDYGYVIGAGFDFRALGFGVRYIQGLTDVGKEQTFFGQPYNFPDGKNSAYQVYVALNFF